MRKLTGIVVRRLTRMLDPAWPQDKVHDFMRREAIALSRRNLSDSARRDLIAADRLLQQAPVVPNWPRLGVWFNAQELQPQDAASADPEAWLLALPSARVLDRAALVPGTGRLLDQLDGTGVGSHGDFVDEQLERLLRHIEICRRRALSRLTMPADAETVGLERLSVTITLSRAARRRGDVRLLNAAFKLNDQECARRFAGVRHRAMLLLSLAEQEVAADELLP